MFIKLARKMPQLLLAAALALQVFPSAAAVPSPEWVGIYNIQGKAGLLWIKTPEIQLYRIYRRRSDEGTFSQVGETAGNRYTDETIQPRIAYLYRLVGVSAKGEESAPSVEFAFTLTPKVREAISPPRLEGSVVLANGLGLKWERLDPTLVVAYNIYRVALPDGKSELLASTRENAFTDFRVTEGKQYQYRVSALDANFKETVPSDPLTVTYVRPDITVAEKAPVYVWTPRKSYAVKILTGGKAAPFRAPTDVALAPSQDLVYVADSGNGMVVAFDRVGDYRFEFPVPPASSDARANPLGIATDKEGRILATDASSGRVLVFQGKGTLVRTVLLPRRKPEEIFGLLDVAPGIEGRLFVVDNQNQRVVVVEPAGKLFGSIGEPGRAPGQFTTPGFLAVDPKEGRILVTEALIGRVQIFGTDGSFLKAFGRYSKNVGGLARPKGIALDSKGRIFIADSWTCHVQAFDDQGRFLFVLADEKGKPLDLGSPNGIAIDGEDNIYIAERLANRVQIRHIQNE